MSFIFDTCCYTTPLCDCNCSRECNHRIGAPPQQQHVFQQPARQTANQHIKTSSASLPFHNQSAPRVKSLKTRANMVARSAVVLPPRQRKLARRSAMVLKLPSKTTTCRSTHVKNTPVTQTLTTTCFCSHSTHRGTRAISAVAQSCVHTRTNLTACRNEGNLANYLHARRAPPP